MASVFGNILKALQKYIKKLFSRFLPKSKPCYIILKCHNDKSLTNFLLRGGVVGKNTGWEVGIIEYNLTKCSIYTYDYITHL